VLSTHDVPEAERFAYWREAICEQLIGISGERHRGQEIPFSCHVDASLGPSLARVRYRGNAHVVFRRPPEIARIGWEEYIWVYHEYSIGASVNVDRGEFVTKRGDLSIYEPTRPVAAKALADCDHDSWLFPRKLFEPHLRASQHPHWLVLGDNGLSRMVKAYLDALARQLDALDDREADLVADNFCRLLAVACGASAGEHQEAIRLGRLEEAKRHINLHLAEPGLAPEKAAAALKMSVRQLHRVFEPSGTTFAQYVTRRRLEECRAAIMNPIRDRAVTDIAFGWGFNSFATFHRNFRQAFDVAPSELRQNAERS
jgi:AraC-like DNA-binding protein